MAWVLILGSMHCDKYKRKRRCRVFQKEVLQRIFGAKGGLRTPRLMLVFVSSKSWGKDIHTHHVDCVWYSVAQWCVPYRILVSFNGLASKPNWFIIFEASFVWSTQKSSLFFYHELWVTKFVFDMGSFSLTFHREIPVLLNDVTQKVIN